MLANCLLGHKAAQGSIAVSLRDVSKEAIVIIDIIVSAADINH